MKHREDIGKLIQNKLSKAHKSPSEELWGKIDDSLEKERKKRGFFIWAELDLNQRHMDFQSTALPTELSARYS